MHVECSSDTVASAMAVVEPVSPQWQSGQRVQGRAGSALWEHGLQVIATSAWEGSTQASLGEDGGNRLMTCQGRDADGQMCVIARLASVTWAVWLPEESRAEEVFFKTALHTG